MILNWTVLASLMLTVCILGQFAHAETVYPKPDITIPLWPGDGVTPGMKFADPKNSDPDEHGLIRKVDKPELRVFLAPADKANGTSVIICPGGGYGLLDYKAHVAEFVEDFKAQGITVIALIYNVPTIPDRALKEGKRAIRLTRSHAAEWKIDPQKVGMQGYSAGGHLILNLLSHPDDGDAQATDPVEKLSSRPNFALLMCPWNSWALEKFPLQAPLPPIFIASADDDKLSYSLAVPLTAKLKELKTPVLFWDVKGGGHSAFHKPQKWGKWMEPLLPFLQEQGFAKK